MVNLILLDSNAYLEVGRSNAGKYYVFHSKTLPTVVAPKSKNANSIRLAEKKLSRLLFV